MSPSLCAFGLDASTGAYLLDPPPAQEVADAAVREQADPDHLREMQHKAEAAANPSYAPVAGLDPLELGEVGWGVVFAPDVGPEVRDALRPLLDLRRQQAGALFRDFPAEKAYRPTDSYLDFLGRSGAGPGPADPEKVPYYLLLVGGPESIPFEFQYHLDVQYGVGRLHFDTPDEYASYARAVVAAETGPPLRPRTAAFVGVKNPDDEATRLSADLLVGPLARWTAGKFPDWGVRPVPQPEPSKEHGGSVEGEDTGRGETTRAGLGRRLGGPDTPALLFTAGHGAAFPLGDPLQRDRQGALVCQDWPGPLEWGRKPIPPEFTFAAGDVQPDVRGLVGFFFACYGAGTPKLDDYPHPGLTSRPTIAAKPFVARLPQRLLTGGALAVVGHVERGWPCSFQWKNAGAQLGVFQGMLRLLLKGQRLGWALDQFNLRYAELATTLAGIVREAQFGLKPDPLDLAFLWTASSDARAFTVLGDPAVRLSAAPAAPSTP